MQTLSPFFFVDVILLKKQQLLIIVLPSDLLRFYWGGGEGVDSEFVSRGVHLRTSAEKRRLNWCMLGKVHPLHTQVDLPKNPYKFSLLSHDDIKGYQRTSEVVVQQPLLATFGQLTRHSLCFLSSLMPPSLNGICFLQIMQIHTYFLWMMK